jgi:hypothetical protein
VKTGNAHIDAAVAAGRVTVAVGPAARAGGPTPKGRTKYGSRATVVGGVRFDSAKEARRWAILQALERDGLISDLKRQVPFDLHAPGGQKVATYWADATYIEDGKPVVEDVKSPPTRKKETYRLKKRWMAAEYGIEIREV